MKLKHLLLSLVLSWAGAVSANSVTVGVVLPLTGPASGLGIPTANAIAMWPKTLAGKEVKVVVMDDATDPTMGAKAAQRLISEQRVDVLLGSTATPVAISMATLATQSGTPQLATSPVALPAGEDKWLFRLAQSNAIMAARIVDHMKKTGIKTVGFLGYTDAFGEQWLKEFQDEGAKHGIRVVGTERFARADTSVTAQALKLVSLKPDAILIVASGSGAGMPQKAIMERGFKGSVYQTHAAATRDLMRTAGKDAEGGYVVSGPATVGEMLPDTHPSKQLATRFVKQYEDKHGANSRTNFAANGFDAWLILEKAVPIALKKAEPGTPEFRAALRDAFETMGTVTLAGGVLNWTSDDHWGYSNETGVILKVVDGKFQVAK